MTWRWVDEEIPYTGAELRSHWLRERFGVSGDGAVGFVGACDVAWEHTIDMDERISRDRIAGDRMVHILCEHFLAGLVEITLRQRLLVSLAFEILFQDRGQDLGSHGFRMSRRGDDLYVESKKLSISVATVSPVSGLIHFGVNVTMNGVPVPAYSLGEMGVDPKEFGKQLLGRYAEETELVQAALVKVRPSA